MTLKPNEYIHRVKGLLVPPGADLDAIADAISEYILIIPEIADNLASMLFADKLQVFLSSMERIVSLLQTVEARWLSTDAEEIIRLAYCGDFDACRSQIAPFITELYSLSVEMQMAQSSTEQEKSNNTSKLDSYNDTANNLSAVERLIKRGEFKAAGSILSDMSDLKQDPSVAELMSALALCDAAKAAEMVSLLKNQYTQLINNYGDPVPNAMRKILAVDDRPEILTAVSQVLKGRYKVIGAPRGDIALKILQSETPDLFLLDIEMPGMDGYALAMEIRSMERHSQTPIIFLTSNATREYVVRAMTAGGNDFIIKPVNNNTLLAKIDKYLS